MKKRLSSYLTLLPACLALSFTRLPAQPRPISDLQLVNGATTRAEVLFKHPNAELLVLRSPTGSTVQTLPLAVIQAVRDPSGRITQVHPARELTEDERTMFERNRVWGDEAGPDQIGRYASETWEPRPLRVWAHPGKSGDALKGENWLDEKGSPADGSPWTLAESGRVDEFEFKGDILLPTAEKPYTVIQPGKRDGSSIHALRHLTVEKHAEYKVRYTVHGNLWVKDGGSLSSGTQTGGMGGEDTNKHTFARFCNYHEVKEPHWVYAEPISHWVWIKTGTGSLEVIGKSGGPTDRLSLFEGTLVISKDSFIGNGNRGAFFGDEGTTLILLDGAGVGCPDPVTMNNRATYGIAGTVMFGTPEKPLTRDLVFGATYYPPDAVDPNATPAQRSTGGSIVLGPTGRMVVHSADPTRARVVFRPRDKTNPWSEYAVPRELRSEQKENPMSMWEKGHVPNGIAAVFRGETDFNGVVFDGFHEGGILVSPEARRNWKNVSAGGNNHAPMEKLFRDL